MRAAYHTQTGGPDVLRVGEQPDPKPGPGDVLIRVEATSLDRVDVYCREGSHGMRWPTPFIGGRDIAGVVVAVGESVGQAHPELLPGAAVVALGTRAHAELAVAPAALTFPKPAACTFEEAAAIPTAGRTAFDALINRVRLKPGETVLIVAGGSGVGSFAIQIAKAVGARVLTTVGSEDKRQAALALGADAVIDHYREDVAARVRELTGDEGVHAVLDHVGTPMWAAAFSSLRDNGRFVTTGVTAGHKVELHLGQLFVRGLELHGIGRPDDAYNREALAGLLQLIERGEVRPVVHASFPLSQVADAHRLMESSSFFGKIVLRLD